MFNSFKAILGLCALATTSLAAVSTVSTIPDFTGAQWIWIPGRAADGITYPPGNATFRRDYYPPAGKTPLSANVLIAVDNAFTLFVNGREVGTGTDFHQAHRYCVPLEPDCNVFAVQGLNAPAGGPSNVGNAAGVISAIEVRYTDGFTETLFTDKSWHGIAGSPAGFQQVAFDDSKWPPAFVEGPIGTTAPWNKAPNLISIPPVTQDPGPDLTTAKFIWTNEVVNGAAPVGSRAFRKTVKFPAGQLADSIVMDIQTDDAYTLYINGLLVGSAASYPTSQRWQVNFIPSNTVTIAIYATNGGGPADILAAAEIRGCVCGCGANAFVVTDETWKFSTAVPAPAGFINPGFDDSNWPSAVVEGPYGMAPWGKVPIPTVNSAPQSGTPQPGAPTAPPASVVA